MTLTLEGEPDVPDSGPLELLDHAFDLPPGHDPVLTPRDQDDGSNESIREVKRRPSPILSNGLGIGTHELVDVVALELRGLASEGLQVRDAVVAAPDGERARVREGTESSEA